MQRTSAENRACAADGISCVLLVVEGGAEEGQKETDSQG